MTPQQPVENPGLTSPAAADIADLKRAVMDFARHASTEISTHDEGLLPELADILPTGMPMYVSHTPNASVEDVVRVAAKVQALGFIAFPHIAARRIPSEQTLRTGLQTLSAHGVRQALLVAGDLNRPVGPFASTGEVIDSGALQEAGFQRIGVAGHPEGNRAIGSAALISGLRHKQEFARTSGISMHIVTQFSFNPEAICTWDRHLAAGGILLPVHVGIAGPTPLPKLIKFAMQCGVGTSMHSLLKNMSAMANLARLAMGPDEMLLGLTRGRAAYDGSHLVQPHFYSFGGALATARWLHAVIRGEFEVQPDGTRFSVNAKDEPVRSALHDPSERGAS